MELVFEQTVVVFIAVPVILGLMIIVRNLRFASQRAMKISEAIVVSATGCSPQPPLRLPRNRFIPRTQVSAAIPTKVGLWTGIL